MKKIAIIITLGVLMVSCKNEKKTEGQVEEKTEISKVIKKKLKSQVFIFFITLLISALSLFNFFCLLRKAGFCKINKRIKNTI